MPLSTPVTSPSTPVEAYANAYFDAATNTLEFGARIYGTPVIARERALSHRIRSNLNYLGPIRIVTPVSDDFIADGVTLDAARFAEVREQERQAREQADREEAARAAERTDGDSAVQPGVSEEEDAVDLNHDDDAL